MIQKIFYHYEENREIFKDYVLRELVGRGRYGAVYLVENRARKRALKVFNHKVEWEEWEKNWGGSDEDIDLRGNLLTNSTTSLSLHNLNDFQSPYIVDILDYGETVMGQSCLLMEYLPLSMEKALAREGKFNEHKASLYFLEILKGLQWQEMFGIVHRDIKPANLFIFADTVKAGDHAFISSPALSCKDGQMPELFGTPSYSAPEAFDGCYSHASDRWAATVIFFQMLTGSLPFNGETLLNIMLAVMESMPDYALIPEKYRSFFNRSFQKNPRERHSDVEEMVADFEEHLIADHSTSKIFQVHYMAPYGQSGSDPSPGVHLFPEQKSKCSAPDNSQLWQLRKVSLTVSEDDHKEVFGLDESGHPLEYIQNRYEASENGTIMDSATGLMWQQSGSEINFSYQSAMDYISQLNSDCFAGHSDWRIPTIAELLSLLEHEKLNGYLYISPLFDAKQQWCWSCDKRTKGSGWYLFFYSGNVNWDFFDLDNYVRGVRM